MSGVSIALEALARLFRLGVKKAEKAEADRPRKEIEQFQQDVTSHDEAAVQAKFAEWRRGRKV